MMVLYVNNHCFFEYEYVNANILKVVLKINNISLFVLGIYRLYKFIFIYFIGHLQLIEMNF